MVCKTETKHKYQDAEELNGRMDNRNTKLEEDKEVCVVSGKWIRVSI